jgi:hypothetical protein
MSAPRPTLYQRITASVPLMITVIVHVVLIAIAGYFVVSEQIIGKKKVLEGAPPVDNSTAVKQVEHRLQVARKGGGSASSSPVSANRIYSTAANALQLPAMPDTPSVGASSLGGVGFGAGMGGVGSGSGFGTGIGTGNGLGAGFMSLSFLGTSSQKVSKVVFVLDVGTEMLELKKGGFEAFAIIREEIQKLIGRLPPNAQFGVVLFTSRAGNEAADYKDLSPYKETLLPTTSLNKVKFFEWMKSINLTHEKTGLKSAPNLIKWTPKELPTAGLDAGLNVPGWVLALRCALEMQPDTIYAILGGPGKPQRASSQETVDKKAAAQAATLAANGLTAEGVEAARSAFKAKSMKQLAAANAKLKAAGKTPVVVTLWNKIFDADVQAELKKNGISIPLDTTGWATKDGRPIWALGDGANTNVDYKEVVTHIAQLQRALLKERAALNIFLFTGPDEKFKDNAVENLGVISSRNGGKFQLITTARLQELTSRDEAKK